MVLAFYIWYFFIQVCIMMEKQWSTGMLYTIQLLLYLGLLQRGIGSNNTIIVFLRRNSCIPSYDATKVTNVWKKLAFMSIIFLITVVISTGLYPTRSMSNVGRKFVEMFSLYQMYLMYRQTVNILERKKWL